MYTFILFIYLLYIHIIYNHTFVYICIFHTHHVHFYYIPLWYGAARGEGSAHDAAEVEAKGWNECVDCSGVVNGSAVRDSCGICKGNNQRCIAGYHVEVSAPPYQLAPTMCVGDELQVSWQAPMPRLYQLSMGYIKVNEGSETVATQTQAVGWAYLDPTLAVRQQPNSLVLVLMNATFVATLTGLCCCYYSCSCCRCRVWMWASGGCRAPESDCRCKDPYSWISTRNPIFYSLFPRSDVREVRYEIGL